MNSRPNAPGPARETPARIAEMLRVDHAGEYAAVAIYKGQQAVFGKSPKTQKIARQLGEMEGEEQKHLSAFDDMLVARGVRPTALAPVWNAAAYGLGVATALMGEKTAHACTEAVETVIEQHYAQQISDLEGESEHAELRETFTEFREDELHHRETAIDEGAQEAPAHGLLSAIIKTGCRLAIRISEKV